MPTCGLCILHDQSLSHAGTVVSIAKAHRLRHAQSVVFEHHSRPNRGQLVHITDQQQSVAALLCVRFNSGDDLIKRVKQFAYLVDAENSVLPSKVHQRESHLHQKRRRCPDSDNQPQTVTAHWHIPSPISYEVARLRKALRAENSSVIQ